MTIHFCFGMAADFGGRPFSLSHYIAVRSAWEVLRPEAMILHCVHEPTGPWWRAARDILHVHRTVEIPGIFGFPTTHPAHRADIVRLAALLVMGGVYLDLDVLVVRSFDGLRHRGFGASLERTPDGRPVGLCNAVLLADADAPFAQLSLTGHDPGHSLWRGFRSRGRDQNYIEYSVRYPAFLADLCPGMVDMLPTEAFLWATWDTSGLADIFERDIAIPDEVRCIHLWESHAWDRYLSQLTEAQIRDKDTTYNRIARRYLPSVPREHSSPSRGPTTDQLARIDLICSRAGYVDTAGRARVKHLWRASAKRVSRSIRAIARRLHNEAQTPVLLGTCGTEPPRRDSSLELVEPLQKSITGEPFVAITDRDEPAICWLLAHANVPGSLWVSHSLGRAAELREQALAAELALRAVHSTDDPDLLESTLGAATHPVGIAVVATGSHDMRQLDALLPSTPRHIIVRKTGSAKKGESPDTPLNIWATRHGYANVRRTADRRFTLLTCEAAARGARVRQAQESKTIVVETLYGQHIHLPRNMVQSVNAENRELGQDGSCT